MPESSDAPPAPAARRRIILEVAAAYALVTLAAAVIYRVRALDAWFHFLVALLFLYVPVAALRGRDPRSIALTAEPIASNLWLVARTVAVVFPPFLAGFVAWQYVACGLPLLEPLAGVPCQPGPLLAHAALRLPPSLLSLDPRHNLLLAELLVIALPEEVFFRGYLQGRLAQALPAPRRSLLGAPAGAALVLGAALFALSHVAVQGNPATMAVFFPGLLFGWMRARTDSVLPGTVFHALCNVYIDTLGRSLQG